MSNLPPEETHGVVTYRTGGVGGTEAAAMRRAEASYPLSLEFVQRAHPKNEFLAYADVTITDHAGNTLLKTFSDGPFMLAKLPDGRYIVKATENGKTETRQVTIAAGKPEHLVFTW
ncbi:MAG TPA: carboxypeptidase-like regulatory domain-containing protein [Casimicrobiaceae bacterium]|nr:carboxypeptidase-like regulatory domain-containing protein [Casimicrobiaceae bacterium]